MKKKNKAGMIVLIIIGVLVVAGFGFYFVTVNQYKTAMSEMTFSRTDASDVPDGTYIGECDVTLVYAKVEVTVKDGQMTDIKLLEHDNGRGTPAEGIEKVVVAKQTLEVDDISGATNSSLVIKKAIDNALASAFEVE